MRCLGRAVCVVFVLWCAALLETTSAQEKSVSPDINKPYEKPDVAASIGRFEKEGRDVYDHREEVVKACRLKPELVVADIGAGTGLFTRLFSPLVGERGRVYAVDIAQDFVKHVEKTAVEQGLRNVVGVVCDAQSVKLPAASIDVAFTSDTYHHFEFPQKTLASIREALRPGGQLIVVDYQRIEGQSSDWILKHVRADKETVIAEILMAGFNFVREERLGFKESYFLRFEKRP
jgi:ubiquinone/menaquinone biosynthesis C-methylase UbiE